MMALASLVSRQRPQAMLVDELSNEFRRMLLDKGKVCKPSGILADVSLPQLVCPGIDTLEQAGGRRRDDLHTRAKRPCACGEHRRVHWQASAHVGRAAHMRRGYQCRVRIEERTVPSSRAPTSPSHREAVPRSWPPRAARPDTGDPWRGRTGRRTGRLCPPRCDEPCTGRKRSGMAQIAA